MQTGTSRSSWSVANLNSPFHTAILVCLVATLSYLAAKLGGALILHPQNVWPLWPGCALLVSVLLLAPRRIWPILIAAAFAAFALYDLQSGVPISSVVRLLLADTVEVLTAALLISYSFNGVPRLDNLKALAKYSLFAVILAPFAVSFLGAFAWPGDYWISWRVSLFSEAIAFLTLTPAILGWASIGPEWAHKSRAYYLEGVALLATLVLLAYLIFVAPGKSGSPALLYSLVPFLLWSALRFGSAGVSTSMIVIACLSIWGAIHGRGPFAGSEPLDNVLSLQLFLLFAAAPFMVLAALVEERMRVEEDLREGEERLRLAMEGGKLGGWEWDPQSGRIPWVSGTHTQFGMTATDSSVSAQDFWDRVHPEDRDKLRKAVEVAKQDRVEFDQEFRVVWPDQTVHWLRSMGRFFFTAGGEPQRMMGISRDITERKRTEQALRQKEAELSEAQRLAKLGSWQWDPKTDTVTWSEELYRIAGRDPNLSAVSYKEHPQLYSPESWERLRRAVEEALRTGTPYELDLEMVRSDGTTRWLIARGEAKRNTSGRIVQLVGTVQDITYRKRAEKTLRESEERFRLATQAGKMYAYEWDVATDAVVRSAESSNILGLTGEPLSLTRQQVLASVHPDDRAMFTKAVEKLTPENPTTQITYRVLRHDDAVIWLEKTARAFFDEQGRMLRMIGMVVDVTERKQAEEGLRESEKRFRLVADTAPALIWMSGTDKLCTFFNKAWLEFTGQSIEHELGEGWVSGVHPEDLERCLRIYSSAFDARVEFEMEYRLRRFDGEYRWIVDYGVPRLESDGTFCGYIGSCVDITERKLTAQSLEDLSGRLITSQEEERARIARELHDDFTQRLALQGIGLTQVWRKMPESETEGRAKIQDLIKENREILSDMHVLSHQLHSSRLEHVGLAPALAGLCEEMSSKYNIEIEFTQLGVSSEIPKDVALCLFRIAQEALGNVVKHSHVKQAQAELCGADNEIRLRVVDAGAGFDPRLTDAGIGLVSMRERLRLVGGTLSVRSAPSKGTEILAQVPLSAQMSETQRRTRAAGE